MSEEMLWGRNGYFREFVLYLFMYLSNITSHWIWLWSEFWRLADKLKGCIVFWFTVEILEFKLFFHFYFHVLGWGRKVTYIYFLWITKGNKSHPVWPHSLNCIAFKSRFRNPVSHDYCRSLIYELIFRFLHSFISILQYF